jgi:predicted nucleic acid-binding Zn ribbon protein
MKKKRDPMKESVHIGAILQDVIKTFRTTADEAVLQVWDLWAHIVGEDVAENAQPAAVKGKILLVHVTSSAWIHHLQFHKRDMIDSINQAFGKQLIEEIKFKIGPI